MPFLLRDKSSIIKFFLCFLNSLFRLVKIFFCSKTFTQHFYIQVLEANKPAPKVHNLERYLANQLEHSIESDPSESGLVLLRVLYGLNVFWWQLYEDERTLPNTHAPILSQSSFHSAKLNSKVSRQLSDFLTVATQQVCLKFNRQLKLFF